MRNIGQICGKTRQMNVGATATKHVIELDASVVIIVMGLNIVKIAKKIGQVSSSMLSHLKHSKVNQKAVLRIRNSTKEIDDYLERNNPTFSKNN